MRSLALLLVAACALPARGAAVDAFLSSVDRDHPDLRAASAQREAADAALQERRGAFDPTLNAKGGERLFHSSSALGKASEAKEAEASLDLLSRWGAKASLGGRWAGGDLKTPVSPTGKQGTLTYSLAVPLLRGALSNPRQAAERKAEIGLDAAQARFEERRQRTLLAAAESWWKRVAARDKLAVERRLLENAEFRLQAVSARVSHGDLPAVARVEAEQEVWLRRGRLRRAERALEQAELALSAYRWGPDGSPAVSPPEDDSDPAQEGESVPADEAAQLEERAIAARPELRAVLYARRVAEVDRSLARNAVLPQLDALWSQGDDRGAGGIGPVRRWGLELSVPLFARAGRGQARQASLTLDGLAWTEAAARQRARLEVRDAVSAVNADAEKLTAARREEALARELEKAERAAYDLGDSTLFLVNQRERAAGEAAGRVVDALAEYRSSRARLRAALTGF